MAKLTFYGATGTVTGSRFLFEFQDQTYFVDCGLFQGRKENRLKNWDPFPVHPSKIDRILLTHAHIDHSDYFRSLRWPGRYLLSAKSLSGSRAFGQGQRLKSNLFFLNM